MWFVANIDILMRDPDEILAFRAVVRFPYEISCILALVPKHDSRGFVARRRCKGMHARVSSGERGLGVLLGNKLRRGESSWSCMKLKVAFFCRPQYVAQGSFAIFSCALPVKELGLLFWPNPSGT